MFDGFGAKVFPTLRERKKFFRFESKRKKKKKDFRFKGGTRK